jgi:hypothetical protein
MAYNARILTSIYGRRMGLQNMSSAQTGATGFREFLVGPEDIRKEVTTADSTGTYLKSHGVSYLSSALSAVGTTVVFRLEPPIPGVEKTIVFGSTGAAAMSEKIFVTCSTGGGEVIQSSAGSTATVMASSVGLTVRLMGVTTGIWSLLSPTTAAGLALTTST